MDPTGSSWGTTSSPMNRSNQAFPPTVNTDTLILNFLDIIIALFGLIGNAVVLWLLGFCMKKTAISIYILNLAGTEFLHLSLEIAESLKKVLEYFYAITVSFPKFLFILSDIADVANMSLISAITIEHCLSGMCPTWYHYHRPRHTSSIMCSVIWTLTFLFSILHWKSCQFSDWVNVNDQCLVSNFIIAAWIILLFVLFSGFSLAMLVIKVKSLCGSQRMQMTGLNLTTGFTVLIFLLCDLPLFISHIFLVWIQETSYVDLEQLQLVTVVLSYVTDCANPIIYFFVGLFRQRKRQQQRWWQVTFKLILQRALEDFPEVDGRRGSPPQETLEMAGSSQMS